MCNIFRQSIALLFAIMMCGVSSTYARDNNGKFVVVIDPGHGGGDSGAKGSKSLEKNINLKVGLKVGEVLKSINPSIVVHYTRSTDKFIGLNERADYANQKKADLFVSIHANSVKGRSSSAKGAETYVLGLARSAENLEVAMKENSAILLEDDYTKKYEGFDPNSSESYIIFEFMQNKYLESSLDVAERIQKGLVSRGLKNRGVRQAGFLVLRRSSMPSVLVELGFISNPSDEDYMSSTKGVNELGESIARAISAYADKILGRSGSAQTTAIPPEDSPVGSTAQEEVATTTDAVAKGVVTYRIQVHTDTRKLKASHPVFRGHKENLSYYKEGSLYKYTLYETADRKEADRLARSLKKIFKDCFVVKFVDGERVR